MNTVKIEKNNIGGILDFVFDKYVYIVVFALYSFIKTFKFSMNYKLPTYAIIFYGFCIFIYRLIYKRNCYIKKHNILLFGLFISTILSAIANHTLANYYSIRVSLSFFISFLVLFIEDNDNKEVILNKLLNFSIVVMFLFFAYSLISLVYYFCVDFSAGRPRGMLHELTYFAQSCVAAVGCSFYVNGYSNNKYLKIFSLISIVFQLTVLLMTMQRGSLLGVFVATIIILICYIHVYGFDLKNFKYIVTFLIVIFLVLAVMFFYKIIDIDILVYKLNSGLAGRDIVYKFGFESMIKNKNYIFGASRGEIENQWTILYNLKPSDFVNSLGGDIKGIIKQAAVHSTILEQLFVHGIIGLVLLLSLYGYIIYKFYKYIVSIKNKSSKTFGIVCSMSFCVFAAMFDSLFNRTLFFDVVYIQNLVFCIFVSALITLAGEN